MKVGSLFAGIGGFDLAARWMGWDTIWFSEIDPYASAVLAKHWPGVPNLGDITRINWSGVERPDLLCGGFPCQDISNAGKRAGISGDRSGLWSEFARAIRDLGPRYVVVENVAALLGRGLDRVLGDLAEIGYNAEWESIPAAAVGAPHLRDRIWILAYSGCQPGLLRGVCTGRSWDGRGDVMAAGDNGSQEERGKDWELAPLVPGVHPRVAADWWRAQSRMDRTANGIPDLLDRLKGLGNAIVPQCAYQIFQAIAQRESAESRAA